MDTTPLLRSYLDRIPETDPERLERLRKQLMRVVDAEVPTPTRIPGTRRGLAFAAVGAIATACVAVGIVTAGPAPRASADASRLLAGAAAAAASVPEKDGFRIYTLHEQGLLRVPEAGQTTIRVAAIVPEVVQLRVPDGTGEWTRTTYTGKPTVVFGGAHARRVLADVHADATRAHPLVEHSPDGSFVNGDARGEPIWENPAALRALPRDPALLLAKLRSAEAYLPIAAANSSSAHKQADNVVFTAATVLSSGAADPALQAALFNALQQEPGVTVTSHVTDVLGRTDAAIGIAPAPGDHYSMQILLDPTTGRFLGTRNIALHADGVVPAGTPVGESAVQQH